MVTRPTNTARTHVHALMHAHTNGCTKARSRPPPTCPLAHLRNPIGAGDIKGNHGDVTTADFDETTAHIITTPLQVRSSQASILIFILALTLALTLTTTPQLQP